MTDPREIFGEVMKRMKNRNLFGENDYYDMVDEVISDSIDNGQMPQEDDGEGFREELEMLWNQEKQRLNE